MDFVDNYKKLAEIVELHFGTRRRPNVANPISVVVVDAVAGEVRLFAWDAGAPHLLARHGGLASPRRVALRGDRLVVWEEGARRLARFAIK